jgi:hypothetical protein
MEHPLRPNHGFGYRGLVGDIGFDDTQAWISIVLLEVSVPADNQIVEHADRAALGKQAINEVASDETGATRD